MLRSLSIVISAAALCTAGWAQSRPEPSAPPLAPSAPQVEVEQTAPEPAASGWLGVILSELPAPVRAQLRLDQRGALLLENIVQDSPAARLLERFDVLLAIDDQPVANEPDSAVRMLSTLPEGRQVKLSILRGAQPQDVLVTLGTRPIDIERLPLVAEPPAPARDRLRERRGVFIDPRPDGIVMRDLPAEVRERLRQLEQRMLLPEFPEIQADLRLFPGEARMAARAMVERDGQRIRIEQKGEQITIQVGEEPAVVYANRDELAANPEHLKLYDEILGGQNRRLLQRPLRLPLDRPLIKVRPMVPEGPEWADLQAELDRMLDQIPPEIRVELGIAPPEAPVRDRVRTPAAPPAATVPPAPAEPLVRFESRVDGTVHVEVQQPDGTFLRQSFASAEELKSAAPERYEQFQKIQQKLLNP